MGWEQCSTTRLHPALIADANVAIIVRSTHRASPAGNPPARIVPELDVTLLAFVKWLRCWSSVFGGHVRRAKSQSIRWRIVEWFLFVLDGPLDSLLSAGHPEIS